VNAKAKIIQAQSELIESLASCEEAISELYASYSKVVPFQDQFWKELSQKEKVHAQLLKSMHALLDNGNIFWNLDRFDKESIDSFLKTVREAIHVSKEKDFSQKEAIETALSVEASVIDSHFYDIVKSDAKEYSSIAGRLSSDTHNHVEAVKNKLMEVLSDKKG
jgi:hypothetical protein